MSLCPKSFRTFVIGGFACLALSLSVESQASSGAKYVRLRVQNGWNRDLTYAKALQSPTGFVGRVLELRGVVGGMAGDDDALMLMLNLPDKSAVNLEIPKAEIPTVREGSTPMLRVLVRLGEGGFGTALPMTVLAVAHDSAVSAIERSETLRANAQRAKPQASPAPETPQRAVPRQTSYASRGGTTRRSSRLDAFLADPLVQQMTAYYQKSLGPRTRDLFPHYAHFIANHNRKLKLEMAGHIAANLLHFSDKYDIDPRLVVAMVIAESDFDPNCTSRVGAMGLGQLMPYTAKDYGIANPYDPAENLKASVQYLKSRLEIFRQWAGPDGRISYEQIKLAMAAYNAGVGAVKKYKGIPPYRETQNYVKRVLSTYQQLTQGDAAQTPGQ